MESMELHEIKTAQLIEELWKRYPLGFVCAFDYIDDGGKEKTAFASSGPSTALIGLTEKLRLSFETAFLSTVSNPGIDKS